MDHDQQDEIPLERQHELQQEEETFRLRQEEQRLRTIRRNHTYHRLINSIYWLAGMLEILLGLRFFLRLFGANPENEFAQLINNLSAPFVAPFLLYLLARLLMVQQIYLMSILLLRS